jgi:hypothetical protein
MGVSDNAPSSHPAENSQTQYPKDLEQSSAQDLDNRAKEKKQIDAHNRARVLAEELEEGE